MSRRKAEFAPSEVPFIARKGRSAGDENLVLVDSDLPIADKKKRSLGKQPHFNQQRSYVASRDIIQRQLPKCRIVFTQTYEDV